MITERYRRDYLGEHVIVNTGYREGRKQQTREWVTNSVVNQHISKRAVVIGSSIDTPIFDYRHLANHRGGPLGKNSLQSYATGKIWRDMVPHFFVTTDQHQTTLMVQSKFPDQCTVCTTPTFCLKYPGRFHLVPYAPVLVDLAKVVYAAAFDGHREIFLIGYNRETPGMDGRSLQDVNLVFQTYAKIQFVLVGVSANMPDLWMHNFNVKSMNYKEFRIYCDV